MKKTQFTEGHILGIPKQVDGGRKIADVCCEHGISDARSPLRAVASPVARGRASGQR